MRLKATAVVAATAATFAAIAVIAPAAVRVPLAIALLLIVPGYFATLALFPYGEFDSARRALFALALSLALGILLALVLNLAGALHATTWAIGLAFVGAALAEAARRRSGSLPRPRVGRWRLRRRDAVLLGLALALLAAALGISRTPLGAKHIQGYTALWITRVDSGNAVRVGLRSGELRALSYRLLVTSDGHRVYAGRVGPVEPGARVSRVVPLGTDQRTRIDAILYRQDEPLRRYRHVTLIP